MIYFHNWELTADCEVIARQHDNLTRSITVTGDLPPDWTWEMYVSAGGNMDILPMQQDETGISVLLTAQNLPVSGEYTFELHGTQGEKTRSTNSIHVYIPPTMSGDAHWPEIPTAFTELEKRMQALANTYPTIGDNGNWVIADKDTGVSAKGLTPFIGDNGNWWIGNEDTGTSASGGSGGSGNYEFGHTLTVKTGKLEVNTATDFSGDNTLPATASLVQKEVGNIEALLGTI